MTKGSCLLLKAKLSMFRVRDGGNDLSVFIAFLKKKVRVHSNLQIQFHFSWFWTSKSGILPIIKIWMIYKEMCIKHKLFRYLMFTVFEDKQPVPVGLYWLLYNLSNINNGNKNCINVLKHLLNIALCTSHSCKLLASSI